ncbi:tripartite tricarboxylate transporter substrate binding protein [uncultured Ramlibacter sp.]|uniref:Bug family tripartite tricarboxylate transporter substrate binding protein n=1 Tax=uncultured Ramlibacter sp. TaxID=260755 RepID=UPI00263719DC|nr:tripartite tricarboxylate transporter substrate-binding protein [uncultured Ramlibacter sp.]
MLSPTTISRRILIAAGLAAAAPALLAQASDGTLRLVVPFGAGTTTDIVSRVLGDGLGKALQQTVVVDNRAGAGGSTGSDQVAKAAPDGRTIVMGTVGTHAINASLFKKLPYDPLRDFAPLALVGFTPTLLVVGADSLAKTLNDLKAMAARPEGVSFASAGNGTSGHLAGEMLAQRLGVKMTHVPYKEGAMAMTAVMGRQVDLMFYHPAAVMPQVKAGKLRALGASSAQRSAAAPEVATLMEQGLADFDLVAWFMLYAPAATPPATLAKLRAAAASVLASSEVAGKLREQGVEQRALKAEELAGFNKAEMDKWAVLVKRSGAQVD